MKWHFNIKFNVLVYFPVGFQLEMLKAIEAVYEFGLVTLSCDSNSHDTKKCNINYSDSFIICTSYVFLFLLAERVVNKEHCETLLWARHLFENKPKLSIYSQIAQQKSETQAIVQHENAWY